MDVDLNKPPVANADVDQMEVGEHEIMVRNAEGKILVRRPKSPLELAIDNYGPAQQTSDWLVHPACADPPAHSGVCTYRFPDGRYWCFKCQVAWTP